MENRKINSDNKRTETHDLRIKNERTRIISCHEKQTKKPPQPNRTAGHLI